VILYPGFVAFLEQDILSGGFICTQGLPFVVQRKPDISPLRTIIVAIEVIILRALKVAFE
jgi:hypothetical protein